MAGSRVRIVYAARAAGWGLVDHTLLTYWSLGMDVKLATRYMEDVFTLNRQTPSDAVGSALSFVAQTSAMPSAEVRKILALPLPNQRPRQAGGAIVFEGDGFRASAIRAVTTALALLVSRSAPPFRAFATMPEALTYVIDRAYVVGGVKLDEHALRDGMNKLRDAVLRSNE